MKVANVIPFAGVVVALNIVQYGVYCKHGTVLYSMGIPVVLTLTDRQAFRNENEGS